MEQLDELLYDDVEAKYLALQNKKKKRKKRRRKRRLVIAGAILLVASLYFMSDISKVKSLEVKGNRFYTKEDVLKKAHLSYETRYMITPKCYLSWKLKKDDFIEDVEIEKSMDGVIAIEIKEKLVIGYFVEGEKNYVLLKDGSQKEITSENLDTIVNYPLIDGFSKKERKNLAAAFAKNKKEVSQDIVSMISEITPHAESYDKHMVKIVMQDGNTIYTSYDSVFILNSYKQTLKNLKKDHVCFVMDANTETYIKEDCKAFK